MSGVWRDHKTEITEDQYKFIVPLNRDTEHLYDNKKIPNEVPFRIIIDAPVLTEPRVWRITKINRINADGLVMVTLAQDKFDQNNDYIELDNDGNVIGMWADYYINDVRPIDSDEIIPVTNIRSEVLFSGTKAEIKSMGSYKKFTVKFYDKDDEIKFRKGNWTFNIIDGDIITPANDIITVKTKADSTDLEDNQIKVKFDGNISYVGKILEIGFTSNDGITSVVDMDIRA